MSTSSSPARIPGTRDVVPFAYAEVNTGGCAPSEPATRENLDALLEASRAQARREAEERVRAEYEAQLSDIRASISTALANFARERAKYYQQVESEVVQLALSIARKILHRESQVDPLLLAGMVHVALNQVERGTKITIRVNPQQVSGFRSYFAHHMEAQDTPEVLEDAGLSKECCILQTSVGTTRVGIDVQLKEIEQGLGDLMGCRPEVVI